MTGTNKLNRNLLIIFVIQALLAAVTWTSLHVTPATTHKESLFNFKTADVTKIEVTAMQSDKALPPVKLVKKDNTWTLASADNFKAKTEEVTKLIDLLTGIKIEKTNPVATSKATHLKLGVDSDSFDRKISITANGKTVNLFIGRGGRSSATVRFTDSNKVFEAAGLSVWNINSSSSNYIDTSYIDVDESTLKDVKIINPKGSLHFVKQGSEWTMPELPPQETAANSASDTETDTVKATESKIKEGDIKRLINKVAKITISDPVGKTVKPEYDLNKGATVTLSGTKDNKPFTITYKIGKKDDSSRYVKADNKEFVIKVSNYTVEDATEKTVGDFIKEPEKKDTDTQ